MSLHQIELSLSHVHHDLPLPQRRVTLLLTTTGHACRKGAASVILPPTSNPETLRCEHDFLLLSCFFFCLAESSALLFPSSLLLLCLALIIAARGSRPISTPSPLVDGGRCLTRRAKQSKH